MIAVGCSTDQELTGRRAGASDTPPGAGDTAGRVGRRVLGCWPVGSLGYGGHAATEPGNYEGTPRPLSAVATAHPTPKWITGAPWVAREGAVAG